MPFRFTREMGNKMKEAKKEFREIIGEAIHTTFRKGCDAPEANEIWNLINNMSEEKWSEYLDFLVWGLEYSGFSFMLKEPSDK
jgi:hypothetical protein